MAKRGFDGEVKQPYSSKLLQMKFMRGKGITSKAETNQKVGQVNVSLRGQAERDDSHWVANKSSAAAGCSLIVEGDPAPGDPTGRFSFQSFNPDTESLKARLEQAAEEAKSPGGKTISDAEMAGTMGPLPKKRRVEASEGQQPSTLQEGQHSKTPAEGQHRSRHQSSSGRRKASDGKAAAKTRYFAA